ncbi:MAG: hypothetical protein GEV08_03220 [Acidimicrobiia bacterium]|nr:hypothetical protein [Acidimicrobiia bacterium]
MHARDELAHSSPGEAAWFESFDLEYAVADASLGGHVTLLRWPGLGRAWYWGSVVQAGALTVTLLETDILLGRPLELRASGIWADQACERPFVHWSYGLEAFALRLDHPDDALGAFRGERVPFGFELEWEAAGAPAPTAGGYSQEGRAHGVLLVGDERVELDGCGRRGHVWGVGIPPIRPGGRFCGPSGWADDAPAEVSGAAVVRLPAPVGMVVRRLLGRSASGGAGWVNLLERGE